MFVMRSRPVIFAVADLNFTTKALRHKADEAIETQNVASLRVAIFISPRRQNRWFPILSTSNIYHNKTYLSSINLDNITI